MAEETRTDKPSVAGLEEQWRQSRLTALSFADFINQTNDGKYNLLGIFDRIYVDPNNPTPRPFGLFVRTSQTREGELTVTGYAPDGEVVFKIIAGIDSAKMEESKLSHLQLGVVIQIEAKSEGVYWFEVKYNETVLGGAPLLVEHRSMEVKDDGGRDSTARGDADSERAQERT